MSLHGIRFVGEYFHYPWHKERLTVVLRAYIDDSGTNMADKVVAVAGFVANERQWHSFETAWKALLQKYDLKRFHAAPYLSRKRPFSRWTQETWGNCGRDICEIFKRNTPRGFGYTVDLQAFEEWRCETGIFINPDPYYWCVDLCLRSLIRSTVEVPKDEGIAIYIDNDDGRENLGVQIGKWHADYISTNPPERIDRNRNVTVTYGSSADLLPIQAADILVHGCFQWLKEMVDTGATDHEENVFLQAMRHHHSDHLTITHFGSKGALQSRLLDMVNGPDSEFS